MPEFGDFSGLHSFVFGLNTDTYSVNFNIQSDSGKIYRLDKTLNSDNFHIGHGTELNVE